ncbi:hypothetical protein BKA81DRAFT_109259 [Phyllosticta paracitricarpa]
MPKDWDAIVKALAQRNATSAEWDAEIDRQCQSSSDKRSYGEWSMKDNFERLRFELTPLSTDFLVENLPRINFYATQNSVYKDWFAKMKHTVQRIIPLGCTSKAFYALRPAPRGLRPDNEDQDEEYPGHAVQDVAFMGVNTNLPISPPNSNIADIRRNRRKE